MRYILGLIIFCLFCPSLAHGFKIGSALSDPCHENLTLRAFFGAEGSGEGQTIFPTDLLRGEITKSDPTWLAVAEHLERMVKHQFENDLERFLAITLFIGVRYPDQAGFSVVDINSLRNIHMAEEGQEEHALRAVTHDHAAGNEQAVQAIRDFILTTVDSAYDAFQESRPATGAAITRESLEAQSISTRYWLEYYGTIKVDVWAPLFYMGRAAHALQDSFSHGYRSADTMKIYAVGNYIEALQDGFNESVDGPKHSDRLDDCSHKDVAPLADSAVSATRALFKATRAYFMADPLDPVAVTEARARVEGVLDTWMSFEPGCGHAEAYCDTPWATLAKQAETEPLLSCSTTSPQAGWPLCWFALACFILRRFVHSRKAANF